MVVRFLLALFLFISPKLTFSETRDGVEIDRLNAPKPAPSFDFTASERNRILTESGLMPFADKMDELDRDLFFHRCLDWNFSKLHKQYPKISTLMQKRLHEVARKERHDK